MKTFKPSANSLRSKLILRNKNNFLFFKKRYFGWIFKVIRKTSNYYINIPLQVTLPAKPLFFCKTNFFNSQLMLFKTYNLFFFSYTAHLYQLTIFLITGLVNMTCKYISSYYQYNVFAKAEGSFGLIIEKISKKILVQLPSKKLINLPVNTQGTPAKKVLSLNKFENYGKAGYNKYFFLKPHVRGTAKNVRDHPNGGRSRVSGAKKSPWGWTIK